MRDKNYGRCESRQLGGQVCGKVCDAVANSRAFTHVSGWLLGHGLVIHRAGSRTFENMETDPVINNWSGDYLGPMAPDCFAICLTLLISNFIA